MPHRPSKSHRARIRAPLWCPHLGCPCRGRAVNGPHDKRLRPSMLLSRGGQNVVIDTTPRLPPTGAWHWSRPSDAILLTHVMQTPTSSASMTFAPSISSAFPRSRLQQRETFRIIGESLPTVSTTSRHSARYPASRSTTSNKPIELPRHSVSPCLMLHGDMEVLGFRSAAAATLTPISAVVHPDFPWRCSKADELVWTPSRYSPPMNQTVEQPAIIQRSSPPRVVTHIAHDLPHAETMRAFLEWASRMCSGLRWPRI